MSELEQLALDLGPELVKDLIDLARMALGGAPKAQVLTKAERFATLAAFKASYRGGQ